MRGVEAPGKALHADAGIVPRALRDLFAAQGAAARQGVELSVSVSYVQIYCEALLDLLDPSSACALSIRERPAHAGGGVFVEGLARLPAESAEAAWDLLAAGGAARRRRRAATRRARGPTPASSSTSSGGRASGPGGGRPHVPYRDSSSRACSASLAAPRRFVAALVPGGDAGGESRSTLEFAGRAARVAVRAAPAEVAVDYGHAEAAPRRRFERATDLAGERAPDRRGRRAPRQGAPRALGQETDLLETRHADALANAKRRAERVAAYRSAADAAAARRRPRRRSSRRRVGHLETLERLNTTKRALADAEKRGAARVGELLAELQDLRDASEDLEALRAARDADAAATLFDRVARLEASAADDQRARDENYVDRATVAEMERLFESTVEKLTGRLADLEERTRLVAGGRARRT
ncbi:hypothetical protein JL720_41 [Aureococcus anophagefferens]|nr:hypothetical protein JL720_41 [Aureococcus anophagefferens]